jgi:hypothetical protein
MFRVGLDLAKPFTAAKVEATAAHLPRVRPAVEAQRISDDKYSPHRDWRCDDAMRRCGHTRRSSDEKADHVSKVQIHSCRTPQGERAEKVVCGGAKEAGRPYSTAVTAQRTESADTRGAPRLSAHDVGLLKPGYRRPPQSICRDS